MIQFLTTTLFIMIITAPNVFANKMMNNLELLGEGEAYYLKFIKVYDAALYIEATADDREILDTGVSKCLRLEYEVPVSRRDFVKAANTVLSRQFTPEELLRVQPEIQRIHDGYIDVESGDTYSLCHNGQNGETTLHHNDSEVVRIASENFSTVYFSIWLGRDKPLDRKLRDNLLARVSSGK